MTAVQAGIADTGQIAAGTLDPHIAAQMSAWTALAAQYGAHYGHYAALQAQYAAAGYSQLGPLSSYEAYASAYGGVGGLSGVAISTHSALQSGPSTSSFSSIVSAAAVDRFIQENRLDDSAARLLRAENPEIQAQVIDRGSLADCRNPSSAVMGRIRDAKMVVDSRRESSSLYSSRGGASSLIDHAGAPHLWGWAAP